MRIGTAILAGLLCGTLGCAHGNGLWASQEPPPIDHEAARITRERLVTALEDARPQTAGVQPRVESTSVAEPGFQSRFEPIQNYGGGPPVSNPNIRGIDTRLR